MSAAAATWGLTPGVWSRHRSVRAVTLGLMWGVAAGAMEAVVLPTSDGSLRSFWVLLAWNCLAWGIVGIGIAWLVDYADWRLERPAYLAAAIVGGAFAFSAVALLFFFQRAFPGPGLGTAHVFPSGGDPVAAFLYQTWIVLFYGGSYTLAWSLNQRAVRMRSMLAQAEVARVRSETLLGEAQLRALRGDIDSRFLLRAMEEVERRYGEDRELADRLVGLLVSFLRVAMPGVRSDTSTLAAEIALARAYASLWSELEPARATWTFDVPAWLPEVRFPPLLLLPILDHLAAASTAGSRGRVTVTERADALSVEFDGDGIAGAEWLASELAYRVRVGLSTLFGERWSVHFRDDAGRAGPALRLLLPPSTKGADS